MSDQGRTGGSENLRGIHYQLLRSLFHAHRIIDLQLEDADEPRWSKLVLEPRDGGDLQLEAPDMIDVEQMKVRSTSWPLYDLIHEVLPDLYKAFVDRSPHRPIREARFVTDAGRGQWSEVEEFFRCLEPRLFIVQGDLSAFAELERADVDDWLYTLALGEGDHINSGTQIDAIRAVSIRDKARAFDAALRLAERADPSREEVPELLFDIDSEKAISWAYRQLEDEDEALMLAAVAENLYAAGKGSLLLGWLQDPSPRVRESACIAAEFLPWDDDLTHGLRALLYDADWYVRNAANQALDRLWHAREIDRLVDALLEEQDATRRWCLLDIVVEGGHPGLWQRQPWIAKLWEQLPLAMRERAAERLKKRRKEVRDELKKRKRREA